MQCTCMLLDSGMNQTCTPPCWPIQQRAHQNTNRWSCWRTAAAASKMACCTRAVRAHSPSGMTQCRQLPALSAESLTAAEQQEEHDTVDAALVAGCDCEGGAAATRQGWWTSSRHRHVLLMLLPLLLLLDALPTSSSCRICCISLLFRAQRDARGIRSAVTCSLGGSGNRKRASV